MTKKELLNKIEETNARSAWDKGVKLYAYELYDYNKKQAVTPAGWLVWSLFDGGCGVVYRREDGKMIICAGWQGEFCYM